MKVVFTQNAAGGWFWWIPTVAQSIGTYSRRRDAKRGLIRFLKGMKKGVEVPE